MREVKIPFQNPGLAHYQVFSGEANPKFGNGIHEYLVLDTSGKTIDEVVFQRGGLAENNVNGLLTPILLQILIDHLQSFQNGNLSNRETAIAITKLEEAVLWLAKRSDDRMNRNVLGKTEKC
jgi:hypothetical protein